MIDKILAVKSGAIIPTSFLSKVLFLPLSYIKKKTLGNWLDKVMTKYDGKETEYLALMIHMLPSPYTGMNGYENDFVPSYICENPSDLPFEDSLFMAYSDPVKDLVRRYGEDYWKPYPEEKRISKHGIVNFSVEKGSK